MLIVDPLKDIGRIALCSVLKPASYIGGEWGAIVKPHSDAWSYYNVAIAFPDLYEIGQSNEAIKIIYTGLNKLKGVRCERVFAIGRDFEKVLKEKGLPLYTLETGMALKDLDMIGFSLGYELGVMGMLSILDCGGIPLKRSDRGEGSPIVIVGGCGATNPSVIGDFIDAAFIGEAEGALYNLVETLAHMKVKGATRSECLAYIAGHPNIWTPTMGMSRIARRAININFSREVALGQWRPLPNIKPVHNHGMVEIMRGCPNGCRFCHAGIYYRPARSKDREVILKEVDDLVRKGGYREISLMSLSSADYCGLPSLLDTLNSHYADMGVSFQLPSLKVNSFTLPLLEKLNTVRKSGLTFAIETPDEFWQLCLNKEVYTDRLVSIILEARRKGWSQAKFYFMIGLPLPPSPSGKGEEESIVDFMLGLQAATRIRCNVNIGVFVPKPHTPYQWAAQISPDMAARKIDYIREHLPRGKFKVSGSSPETALIEGLLSRGDNRAGAVILSAYKAGCRLDAWEDNMSADISLWQDAFATAPYDVVSSILQERSIDSVLPWDNISLGPSKAYYIDQRNKGIRGELTPPCAPVCDHRCGVCNSTVNVTPIVQGAIDSQDHIKEPTRRIVGRESALQNIKVLYRVLFSFYKVGKAMYIPYLSLCEIFRRALFRANLPIVWTEGYNPLPRLEFATAIGVGIVTLDEVAQCLLYKPIDAGVFCDTMNELLPQGLRISRAFVFPQSNRRKRAPLAASLWGARQIWTPTRSIPHTVDELLAPYAIESGTYNIPASEDKGLRLKVEGELNMPLYQAFAIKKVATMAENKGRVMSYFELYEDIARINYDLIYG